jgi:AraC-like DNA-binding protein/quercetin dioxygenase-like cupin family protein
MSKTRQGDVFVCPPLPHAVTTLRHELPDRHEIPRHLHPEHQLIYASRGVMSVWTPEGTWIVPPQRAVWIPAKTPHAISMYGAVSMRTLYVKPRLVRLSPNCRVVHVSPLLRELILHACTFPTLRRRAKEQAHLIDMILDQLKVLELSPLLLVDPTDARALRVAEALAKDPGARQSLDAICERAGASRRTIERLFLAETNMSLGRWRQQLRLACSLRLLAKGESITRAAQESGYSTPSAFVAMFRKALGTTPRRYFENGGQA